MTIRLCGRVGLPSSSHRPWEMFLHSEAVATETLLFSQDAHPGNPSFYYGVSFFSLDREKARP